MVVTQDGLVSALQGRLQQAVEKAVRTAVANQLDEAVRNAVAAIDEVRQSSIREVQQLAPARTEPTAGEFAAKDEIAAAISARWQEEMEKHRVHAEELTQRLASQAAELKRELDRCEEFLEAMNSELEPRAEARLNEAVARAASEFDGAAARAIARRLARSTNTPRRPWLTSPRTTENPCAKVMSRAAPPRFPKVRRFSSRRIMIPLRISENWALRKGKGQPLAQCGWPFSFPDCTCVTPEGGRSDGSACALA